MNKAHQNLSITDRLVHGAGHPIWFASTKLGCLNSICNY
ncbi:MAG: hypothetical protein ACI8VR_002440, partial [Candidatus Azotimanducaceae bacterium]